MAVKETIEEAILKAQAKKLEMSKGLIEKTDKEVDFLLNMIEKAQL